MKGSVQTFKGENKDFFVPLHRKPNDRLNK